MFDQFLFSLNFAESVTDETTRRLSSVGLTTKDGSEDTTKKSDLLQVSVINGNGKRRGSYTVTIVPGKGSVDTSFWLVYKLS